MARDNPISIKCENCDLEFQARYLRAGDSVVCKGCGGPIVVPRSVKDYAPCLMADIGKSTVPPVPPTAEQRVVRSLILVAVATIPLLVGFMIFTETGELRATLIGRILILTGLFSLKEFCVGRRVWIAVAASGIGLAIDIAAIFGFWVLVSFLPGLEILLIWWVVDGVARNRQIANRVRMSEAVSLALTGFSMAISAILFISAPLIPSVFEFLMSMFGPRSVGGLFLGMGLPLFLITLASVVSLLVFISRVAYVIRRSADASTSSA